MPGFLGVAAALWLHARTGPLRSTACEAAGSCVVALVAAALGSAAGARDVTSAFALAERLPMPGTLPHASFQAVWRGVYTLTTWSVFVLASRHALLITRSFRPFVLPAVMSVVLALVRPWTVDDFVSLWRERTLAGDPIACASLVCGAGVIALLIASERGSAQPQPGQPDAVPGARAWRRRRTADTPASRSRRSRLTPGRSRARESARSPDRDRRRAPGLASSTNRERAAPRPPTRARRCAGRRRCQRPGRSTRAGGRGRDGDPSGGRPSESGERAARC